MGLGAVSVGATKLVEVVKNFYHAGNALAFLGNFENKLSQVMPRYYTCQDDMYLCFELGQALALIQAGVVRVGG